MNKNVAIFFSDIDGTITNYSEENYKKYIENLEVIRIKLKVDLMIFCLITYDQHENYIKMFAERIKPFLTENIVFGNQFFGKGILNGNDLSLKETDKIYNPGNEYYKSKTVKIVEYVHEIEKDYNVIWIGYVDDYIHLEDAQFLDEYLNIDICLFEQEINPLVIKQFFDSTFEKVKFFFSFYPNIKGVNECLKRYIDE